MIEVHIKFQRSEEEPVHLNQGARILEGGLSEGQKQGVENRDKSRTGVLLPVLHRRMDQTQTHQYSLSLLLLLLLVTQIMLSGS